MTTLTKEQVVLMHSAIIMRTGGLEGIRDDGLLYSSINSYMQSFGGMDLYPTIQSKAAQIGFSLIKNHPFNDGNKRIGVLVMMSILELNEITIDASDKELITLGMSIAQGKNQPKI